MRRLTSQKKLIADEISKLNSFFDAYELHKFVEKRDRKIGLATIYRFLNSLETEGSIHSFVCDNKKIYSNSKTSHTHFRCEKCNKLEHIKVKNVDFLDLVEYDICHFQIELVGVCKGCKRNLL